jgi:hypothetical protein
MITYRQIRDRLHRDPEEALWDALQRSRAERARDELAAYEEYLAYMYGSVEAGWAEMARREIDRMNAELLARRWAHRSTLYVEVELAMVGPPPWDLLDGLPEPLPPQPTRRAWQLPADETTVSAL